jgi:hypothetical protein
LVKLPSPKSINAPAHTYSQPFAREKLTMTNLGQNPKAVGNKNQASPQEGPTPKNGI